MKQIKKIHFIGIGGVGMGSFAVALAQAGYEVSGSDGVLYEPMKGVLARANIRLFEGYVVETLNKVDADLAIIGNVIRKENPEARAWVQSATPFYSFPEAVRRFLIEDKTSIVCAGTHGKTSTTSWIAFLLEKLGLNPSYLIGGVPVDLPQGSHFGQGKVFVGEGDEYDSAFFDKGPKFLHYKPDTLVLSNIEFDHADIYRDLNHVRSSFEKLIAILPGDGLCVARYEDNVVMDVVTNCLCPVQTFGLAEGAMWRLSRIEESLEGFKFEILYKGKSFGLFRSPLLGVHNLLNILSGIVAAVNMSVRISDIEPIVPLFRGVRRRQEYLMRNPVVLIDDFAHHPTEVKATIDGLRRRYPKAKLMALFEPRSATARRNIHQADYAKAFDSADEIIVSQPFKAQEVKESERFNAEALVSELCTKGKKAFAFDGVDSIVDFVVSEAKPEAVIVVMSNGEFGKIQEKLLRRFT